MTPKRGTRAVTANRREVVRSCGGSPPCDHLPHLTGSCSFLVAFPSAGCRRTSEILSEVITDVMARFTEYLPAWTRLVEAAATLDCLNSLALVWIYSAHLTSPHLTPLLCFFPCACICAYHPCLLITCLHTFSNSEGCT